MCRVWLLAGLAIVLAVLGLVGASVCPNNCSNHGQCNEQTKQCTCNEGFGSIDCSIAAKILQRGAKLTGQSVTARQWHYYYTPSGSTSAKLTYEVITTSSTGDIDIFVQQGRLPTRTDYLARNITTSANFTVSVDEAKDAVYYAGIYGFSGKNIGYSISVKQESECPKGCSGHGSCQNGECVCHPDFTGPACEEGVKMLTIDKPVTAEVQAGTWKYYRIHAIVENTLRVIVNQTSTTGDLDLYIKFNKIPTRVDYDLADQTLAKNFYLDIQLDQSTFGFWNLGVYGLQTCSFSISYTQYNDCPNSCSLHGVCNTKGCKCDTGYSGNYCETKTAPLENRSIVKGFVGDNTWNWYTHTPSSTAEMVISVNETGTKVGQDCDVYVRRGLKPSLTSYDYRNITLASKMTIRIPEPQFAEWHIGVFGFRACAYFISVVSTDTCAQCGEHGSCDSKEGICVCNPGWTGEYCDTPIQMITNYSQPITDSLKTDKWHYYSVQGIAGRSLAVHLKELNSVGFFWLFLNPKTPPTLTNFNSTLSDKESNTNMHRTHIESATDDIWYIGVYGSPFSVDRDVAFPYELQAWESPFRR